MKSTGWKGLAICTILVLVPGSTGSTSVGSREVDAYSSYQYKQISQGAQKFPVLAQLTYFQALNALQAGNLDQAEELLRETVSLDPSYADPYFALAKIKARQFSSDTLYYFSLAIARLIKNFHYQRLLVVNGVIFLMLMTALLASIFCIAFLLKYLPFAAHRLGEMLGNRFSVALPKLTAYLLLVIPFALLPGFVTGLALMILISWGFMLKREKFFTILMVLPFIALGFFSKPIKQLTPLVDPSSLTSHIAAANESPGSPRLFTALERTSAGTLDTEKDLALGLLHFRSERFMQAATYFLRAISRDPGNMMAYVNLGNVYYLQGDYDKALEGYRKASALDPLDAVCQYNLAQAYIKTLLLAESSKALKKASAFGIETVKQSYASSALKNFPVYPKTFSNEDLWRISRTEGESYPGGDLSNVLLPLTHFTPGMSAWILAGALFLAILIFRFVDRRKLTFQCSNCGELTCEGCCIEERGRYFCQGCAASINDVSSEKVIDALLRQRRLEIIVKRRKSARLLTSIIPGIRDMYYGRILRGIAIAALFSISLLLLWAKGLIVKDWATITTQVSIWKIITYAVGAAAAWILSIFSKPPYGFRNFLLGSTRTRSKEQDIEDITTEDVA